MSGRVGLLGDVDVSADGDVHVADGGTGRPPRAKALATQHEVLGDANVDLQLHRREAPTIGAGCDGLSSLLRLAAAGALRVRQRLTGRILGAPAVLRRLIGRHDVRHRVHRVRVVEQRQYLVDLQPRRLELDLPFDLRPPQLAGDLEVRSRRRRFRARCRSARSCVEVIVTSTAPTSRACTPRDPLIVSFSPSSSTIWRLGIVRRSGLTAMLVWSPE